MGRLTICVSRFSYSDGLTKERITHPEQGLINHVRKMTTFVPRLIVIQATDFVQNVPLRAKCIRSMNSYLSIYHGRYLLARDVNWEP